MRPERNPAPPGLMTARGGSGGMPVLTRCASAPGRRRACWEQKPHWMPQPGAKSCLAQVATLQCDSYPPSSPIGKLQEGRRLV